MVSTRQTALKNGIRETSSGRPSVYEDIPPGHAGFRAAAADAILNGVVEDLKSFRKHTGASRRNAPLFITGHSLGGAIALLVRPKVEKSIPVEAVYVYGAPIAISNIGYPMNDAERRFLDTTFLHRYNGVERASGIWRRLEQDNVPRLRARSWTYRAPGNSFELYPDGELKPYPAYDSIGLLPSAGWGVLWLTDQVTPHNLEKSYLPALKRAAERGGGAPVTPKWWRK